RDWLIGKAHRSRFMNSRDQNAPAAHFLGVAESPLGARHFHRVDQGKGSVSP
ncbi:hypothetical protein PISMIDRAFT_683586, partial [Pisolithus microcarpus 441]